MLIERERKTVVVTAKDFVVDCGAFVAIIKAASDSKRDELWAAFSDAVEIQIAQT